MGLCFKIYQNGRLTAAADEIPDAVAIYNRASPERPRILKYRGGVLFNSKKLGFITPGDLVRALRDFEEKRLAKFRAQGILKEDDNATHT